MDKDKLKKILVCCYPTDPIWNYLILKILSIFVNKNFIL